MIKFLIKQRAKVLICISLSLYINCQNNFSSSSIEIIKFEKSNFIKNQKIDSTLIETCKNWSLSEESIKEFFVLSEEFKDNPYGEFYTLPCEIEGELISSKEKYNFTINAGGISTWNNNEKVRYFGCKSPECEKYLLIFYDGMSE